MTVLPERIDPPEDDDRPEAQQGLGQCYDCPSLGTTRCACYVDLHEDELR